MNFVLASSTFVLLVSPFLYAVGISDLSDINAIAMT